MKAGPRIYYQPRQDNTILNKKDSIRSPSEKGELYRTQNIINTDIKVLQGNLLYAIKKGQEDILSGQKNILSSLKDNHTVLTNINKSIDNLTRKIGDLFGNGHENYPKNNSSNKSSSSDYSKKSSDTAFYRRRNTDKKEVISFKREEIPGKKDIKILSNFGKYTKINKH